jgi:hypothetical protein
MMPGVFGARKTAGDNSMIAGHVLFPLLKSMDEEAIPVVESDGTWRTGLCCYYGHERRAVDWTRDDSERAWCRRLAQTLPGQPGIRSVEVDRPYPDGSGYADLVAMLESGDASWIEVKGAWTARLQRVPLEKNPNLAKHLIDPKESLAKDFTKLSRLSRAEAGQVGVLLIGFEVSGVPGFRVPDELLDHIREAGRVLQDGWQEEVTTWSAYHQGVIPGRTTQDFQVKCWFWHRQVL